MPDEFEKLDPSVRERKLRDAETAFNRKQGESFRFLLDLAQKNNFPDPDPERIRVMGYHLNDEQVEVLQQNISGKAGFDPELYSTVYSEVNRYSPQHDRSGEFYNKLDTQIARQPLESQEPLRKMLGERAEGKKLSFAEERVLGTLDKLEEHGWLGREGKISGDVQKARIFGEFRNWYKKHSDSSREEQNRWFSDRLKGVLKITPSTRYSASEETMEKISARSDQQQMGIPEDDFFLMASKMNRS